MSVTPSQLSEIHKELIARFISHPTISINPTQGDPPEEYDISYQIGGMVKTEDGEVHETFGHTISLTIPFGYPHFPPSCKPKGAIFHPDFDPAAICITSFWEQEHSLSELIINIGRMINGEIYSTSNFFNEDAGEWYQRNSTRFPLSNITWTATIDLEERSDDNLIDTLDDSDLSTDFNFHEIELADDVGKEDISISDAFPHIDSPLKPTGESPLSPSQGPDLSEISLLNSQKKYVRLQQLINETTHTSEELHRLYEKSGQAIKQAQELYDQAKGLEDQGKSQQALRLFEQVASTVQDYPAIQADLKRVKQTLALLQDISPELLESQQTELESSHSETEESSSTVQERAHKNKATEISQKSDATFFEEKKSSVKVTLLTIAVLFLAISTLAGYLWYTTQRSLNGARQAAASCNNFLQERSFAESKIACEQGLSLLNKVKFIHQAEVVSLRNSLNKILQSEQLNQGIAGNVLFNGKYLSKEEAEHQRSLLAAMESANTAFTGRQWKKALEFYTEVQKMTLGGVEDPPPLTKQELNYRIGLCRFKIGSDEAMELMTLKKWEKAIQQFQASEPLLAQLSPEEQTANKDLLHTNLSLSHFNNLKEKGDISFAESKWQEASSFYSEALTHLKQKNQILPEAVTIIQSNNKRAQLYKTITEGNQAFSATDWDQAIAAYDRADAYIRENSGLLSLNDARASRKKLAQIRLQASIIRDKQIADTQVAENKLKKARTTYQTIIQNIDTSAHSNEEMFSQGRKELLLKIEELNTTIYKQEKIAWLTENFQTLFLTNYPASNKENLTNPLVTFIKEQGSKSVFRMQCSETGRGRRPLTLVMFYAFDKQTNSWNLYSEQ